MQVKDRIAKVQRIRQAIYLNPMAHLGAIVRRMMAGSTDQAAQLALIMRWRQLAKGGEVLPLGEVEFRGFSQNGEDGILLYLLALVGFETRKSVEICAGDGIECNTANLLVNHGFTGLLVDGKPGNVRRAQAFYSSNSNTWTWPPTITRSWVTAENVNSLIADAALEGDIDVLSLDLDGIDYWIWKAIHCVSPRVVVLEYQDILGPEVSLTVPYDPEFTNASAGVHTDYGGASLAAFVGLGREKGYRLVGVQRYGFNAFFLREGVGEEFFPEVAAASCFTHPKVLAGMRTRAPRSASLPWVEV